MDEDAREKISAFLYELSKGRSSSQISDALTDENNRDLLLGALTALEPLGLFEQTDTESRPVSDRAQRLLRSWSFLVKSHDALIEDWARLGSECRDAEQLFNRGVYLLAAIEKKRSVLQPDRPLDKMIIAKAVVTGRTPGGQPFFLLVLNDRSNCYQFVGGKLRGSETPATAMAREIEEELPKGTLQEGRDFTLEYLKESSTAFVSPTFGAFLKYEVHHFHVRFTQALSLSRNHYWAALDELRAGETLEGTRIIPAWNSLGLSADELLKLPPSISTEIEVNPVKAASPGTPESSVREATPHGVVKGTAAAIAVIAFTIGSLTAASRLAPRYFTEILLVTVPVLLVMLGFVARAAGWIEGKEMLSAFRLGANRSSRD